MEFANVLLFSMAVAIAGASTHDGDVLPWFQKYFQDFFTQLTRVVSNAGPELAQQIRTNVPVSPTPNALQTLHLLSMACRVPMIEAIDYMGPVCVFLGDNSKAIDQLINTANMGTMPGRCQTTSNLDSQGNIHAAILDGLKEMSCMIERAEDEIELIGAIVAQYGVNLEETELFNVLCNDQRILAQDELRSACMLYYVRQDAFKMAYKIYENIALQWVKSMEKAA